MATLVSKTYILPSIVAVRSTIAGTQYTVTTPEYIDTVTVNGAHIACTCGELHCEHSAVVETRRAREATQDARHACSSSTFDLSYGDAA